MRNKFLTGQIKPCQYKIICNAIAAARIKIQQTSSRRKQSVELIALPVIYVTKFPAGEEKKQPHYGYTMRLHRRSCARGKLKHQLFVRLQC